MAANCDDHTKNVSFLMRQGGPWEIAPAYDVTYAQPEGRVDLSALDVGQRKIRRHRRGDLLAVANRFGVGTAPKVMKMVQEAVAAWPDFAAAAGVDPRAIARIRERHRTV